MEQIITDDKEILKRFHAKEEMGQENDRGLCPYCNKPKRRMGRMFVCTCTGSAIRLPSGKNIKRNQKF